MFSRAMTGNMPLFAVHVKPLQSDVCAASKNSYLSQQQPPTHTPQDTPLVPPCVLAVVNKLRLWVARWAQCLPIRQL